MKMKKFVTWCLAMIMCIAFSLSALAAGTESQVEEGETEATEEAVTILYTNDIHTYITEDLTYSMVAGYRDTLDNVLLVDAGDHIQGTAYGSMDNGETIIEIMNAAGYDLATLGNHEFDYGMEGALQAVEWADFPYVSCNFYHEENGVVGENVLDSYQVFEVNGVKIAFVGITTPDTFSKSTPKYFQDEDGNYIYGIAGGTDGTELYESVQTAIDDASKEADLVIALGHLGVDPSSIPWTSEEVIANTTGLDAFIDGHSHTTMEGEYVTDKDGNEVLLTQTGYYFSALGQMTITADVDTETDTTEYNITTELLTAEDLTDVTPNAEVETIEQEWITEIDEKLGEQIGESDIEFTVNDADGNRLIRKGETNIGDFNADAYYWYMNEADGIGCDIAIMNGGGIRATIEAGEWTYLTCKNINPFGNVLCVVEASGQDILDALEYGARYTPTAETGGFMHVAGLMFEIDTSIESTVQADENEVWVSGPTEEYRVQNVKVYNKETGTYEDLVLDQMYSVAGTNYTLRNCGDGFDMFSDVELVKDYIVEDYMALAAYAMAFTDSDGNGYSNLSTENSPLSSYNGYLLNYENIAGSGRITVSDGSDDSDTSHQYVYTDNGDGTHTATCEDGDDSFTEAHTYENGICTLCGAVESTAGDTSGSTSTAADTTEDTTKASKTGKTYTVGNAKYKITSSNTVSFAGVVKKKKTVTIPSSVTINGTKYRVTAIAAKAFKGDKKIQKVVIPSTVTKIGKKAFYNCKKLKTINIKSKKLNTVGKKAISGINKKATIKVPKGKKAAYKKLFKTKTGYRKTMKIKVKA